MNNKFISPKIKYGKLRLLFRWNKFALQSIIAGNFDFFINALSASIRLLLCSLKDLFNQKKVKCIICGWQGYQFYPNVGSGYYELKTTCPRCLCQDRHRSLIKLLWEKTDFFSSNTKIIEVAPMRSLQQYFLEHKNSKNYISFDYERFAMEQGDITQMRFENESCDYFLCFHVLEHILDEQKALSEIYRVINKKGKAILQVPIDLNLDGTVEYNKPDPKETNHVRRYGKDFPNRLREAGFLFVKYSITDIISEKEIIEYGYNTEPIYFAYKG